MKLTTIKDVEIAATGKYALESGEAEFTADHLADAVRASTDPTIVAPRIKLGHDFEKVFGDAAPAFGKVTNMRLAGNGQKIVGDLIDVPEQLAASIASSYPGRSIEGGFDFDAPSGNQYKLVISDLALLGTQWPGITSLKDLTAQDVLDVVTANGQIETPVEVDERYKLSGGLANKLVTAKLADPKAVTGKLNVADFRKLFAADLQAGTVPKLGGTEQGKWWARSIEAGDDGRLNLVIDDEAGHLIELPVAVEGDRLKYDGPRFREAVAASNGNGPRVLASWPSKGTSPSNEERQSMKREQIIARLGLPEDATDEQIVTATAEHPEKLTAEEPDPGNGDEGKEGAGKEGTSEEEGAEEEGAETTDGATLVTASGKRIKLGDGMVVVDKSTFDEVKAGAAAGKSLAQKAAEAERDTVLTAAINEGRFAAGQRKRFEKLWTADPEGTREVIAALDPGVIPVDAAVGREGSGEAGAESEEALVASIQAQMFPELRGYEGSVLARASATNGGAK